MMQTGRAQEGRGWRGVGLVGAGVVTVALAGVMLTRALTGSGPAGADASPAAIEARVEAAVSAARAQTLQGRHDRAEAILRDALDRDPSSADLRIALAECLLDQDRPAEAYEQYNEAIGLTPDRAELHAAAGTVASVAGLLERAEAHYRTAQTLDPTNPKHALNLGVIERTLGKPDAARADLLRAAQLAPTLAVAWGALADLSLDENRLDMAEHYIAKALALEPDRPAWRLTHARILRRQGDPERAAVMLAALSDEQDRPDPIILRERALCLGLLGRQDEAAALYDRACQTGHPDPAVQAELLYEAALWHERLGQTARASDFAAQAADLGDPRAARLRDRLARGG
ncbi:MAG: tetratricopeptide repeat protein [Planctomycetota bacterium]|nr:MAG: tetratricopeptide repeat protein [Planctomycetota bacterium]